MSKFTNEDYCALAAVVADQLPAVGNTGIVVDTDGMNGCIYRLSPAGACTIDATCEETIPGDFLTAAARICGQNTDADRVFAVCGDMRGPFKRYLRRGKTDDEALPGLSVGCKALNELYESNYSESLHKLVQTLRDQSGEDAPVVLIGRLAAFYPAEHTVRQMLSFMPFSPVVEGLVTDPALTIPVETLIVKGKAILEEREKAKKRIAHNVMIQFKRVEGDKLTDWLHILANKGSDLASLENPVYSDMVLASAEDFVVLFADSTPYRLRLPKTVFSRQTSVVAAQFALGLDGETPKLLVKTADGVTQIDIEDRIYTEE